MLILSASTLLVGGLAVAMFVIGLTSGTGAWLLIGISTPILITYSWAWIRVWRVGVVIRDDKVVITSWFSSECLGRREMSWWSSDSYTRVLFVLGWPVAGGALEPGVLSVDLVDGTRRQVAGTVSLRSSVRAQARFLNAWLRDDIKMSTNGKDT